MNINVAINLSLLVKIMLIAAIGALVALIDAVSNNNIWVAVIVSIPSTIAAIVSLLSWIQSKKNTSNIQKVSSDVTTLGKTVDGKMTELISTTERATKAETKVEAHQEMSTLQARADHAEGVIEGAAIMAPEKK